MNKTIIKMLKDEISNAEEIIKEQQSIIFNKKADLHTAETQYNELIFDIVSKNIDEIYAHLKTHTFWSFNGYWVRQGHITFYVSMGIYTFSIRYDNTLCEFKWACTGNMYCDKPTAELDILVHSLDQIIYQLRNKMEDLG